MLPFLRNRGKNQDNDERKAHLIQAYHNYIVEYSKSPRILDTFLERYDNTLNRKIKDMDSFFEDEEQTLQLLIQRAKKEIVMMQERELERVDHEKLDEDENKRLIKVRSYPDISFPASYLASTEITHLFGALKIFSTYSWDSLENFLQKDKDIFMAKTTFMKLIPREGIDQYPKILDRYNFLLFQQKNKNYEAVVREESALKQTVTVALLKIYLMYEKMEKEKKPSEPAQKAFAKLQDIIKDFALKF